MATLIGYGRVSGDTQEKNSSLETQKESIIRYCEQNNHILVGYYEDVETGATLDRENFQWALKSLEMCDGMIVYRQDRLTRSVFDGERLKMVFKKQGKLLLSVADSTNLENYNGEFVFTITSAIAELERMRIIERCNKGRNHKRANGGRIGGAPPYGYCSFKGTLMEVPGELAVIEMMRKWHFEDGDGYSAIVHRLHKMGVKPKNKDRSRWSSHTVKRICQGDPPVVQRLRIAGKILPATEWDRNFGALGIECGA